MPRAKVPLLLQERRRKSAHWCKRLVSRVKDRRMTRQGRKSASRLLRRWGMGFSKFSRNAVGDLVHNLRNQRLLGYLTLVAYLARGPSFWVSGPQYPVLDRGSPIVLRNCSRITYSSAYLDCAWRGYAHFVVAHAQYLNQIRTENELAPVVANISVRLFG